MDIVEATLLCRRKSYFKFRQVGRNIFFKELLLVLVLRRMHAFTSYSNSTITMETSDR